jgi:hypothetical protein
MKIKMNLEEFIEGYKEIYKEQTGFTPQTETDLRTIYVHGRRQGWDLSRARPVYFAYSIGFLTGVSEGVASEDSPRSSLDDAPSSHRRR